MIKAVLVFFATLMLASCSEQNPARVDFCLAALTGLEPDRSRISVDSIGGDGGSVTVEYRAGQDHHRIECQFEGSAVSLDQLDLRSLKRDGEALGVGRLLFLKRQWLTGEGITAIEERIILPPAGFFTVPVAVGVYLQMALSALPIASVYVLLALGFALIHGITGRISIAHGEFATVGAYAGFAGFMAFGVTAAPLGIAAALLLAAVAAGCAGLLTVWSVFEPLARRDGQMLLVASAGLILVYEEGVRLSHASRELWLPPIYSTPIALTKPPFVVTITVMQLAVAVAVLLAVLGFFAFMRLSRFGMSWRAVSDDPMAARFMGIDPSRVLAISAALASALGGGGGLIILLGYGNANFSMGLMLSVKAMVAALMGGMGSLGGAVAGALILVSIETFWVAVFGGAYRDAAVFIILVGLLTLIPDGLFSAFRK